MFMSSFLGLYLFLSLCCIIVEYTNMGKKMKTTFNSKILAIVINCIFIYSIYWIYTNNIVNQSYPYIVTIIFAWLIFDCIVGTIVTLLQFNKYEINMTKFRVCLLSTMSAISAIVIISLYFIM